MIIFQRHRKFDIELSWPGNKSQIVRGLKKMARQRINTLSLFEHGPQGS